MAEARTTVTVNVPVPMPTATLTLTPSIIEVGQSATLSWTTTDAASVTLDGATVNPSGTRLLTPTTTGTITYTLRATNASGNAMDAVTLTVNPKPVVALTYVKDIKPILDANCSRCHSGSSPTAGVDLTTYANVMRTVTPGSSTSLLVNVTRVGGKMHGYLTPDPVGRADMIRRWVVDFAAAEQ
jgi:hypothetical protein